MLEEDMLEGVGISVVCCCSCGKPWRFCYVNLSILTVDRFVYVGMLCLFQGDWLETFWMIGKVLEYGMFYFVHGI